jgi:hypothetical protein
VELVWWFWDLLKRGLVVRLKSTLAFGLKVECLVWVGGFCLNRLFLLSGMKEFDIILVRRDSLKRLSC